MDQKADSVIPYWGKNRFQALASKISMKARKKMFARFMDVFAPTAESRVLDVGATPDGEHFESNFFEQLYPYRDKLTATSVEDISCLKSRYPGLTVARNDPYSLPFSDQSFDYLVCFAVMEHVGSREQQGQFLRECLRVGKQVFFVTPNRFFPFEMHTGIPLIQWFPTPIFHWFLRLFGKEYFANEQILNLLTRKEFLSLIPKNISVKTEYIYTFGWPSNILLYTRDGDC